MNIPPISHRMKRAWLLYRQKRFTLALAEISEVLSIEPEHDEAHSLRGLCLASTSNYEEGLAAIQTAIAIDPDQAYSYYYLAHVQEWHGDLVLAKQAIDRAIKLEPENPHFRLTLARIVASLSDQDLARIEKLLPALDLEIALSLPPGTYRQALKELVISLADRVLEVDPENIDALYLRLDSFYLLNRLIELEAGCYQLLEINPNHAPTYNMIGLIYQKRQDWSESIRFFKSALNIQPDLAMAYSNLSYSCNMIDKTYDLLFSMECRFELAKNSCTVSKPYCKAFYQFQ
jgi:tetratricopeptide (TPR) repeat protein